MKYEKILITGGCGYIGSVLTQKLMESKKVWSLSDWAKITPLGAEKQASPGCYNWKRVTVYDNLMYRQTSLANYCYKDDFVFVKGDVRDEEKLLPYVQEADVIIPLAAIVGFPACDNDKDLATKVNYDHVKFILDNKKPEAKVIYPNTNSGYGIGEGDTECTEESPLNPISHYGKTKCAAEKEVLAAGGISFRLATVFGVSPRMRLDLLVNDFTYRAYSDGYLVLFEPHFSRNYIHIQDVALAFMKGILEYDTMGGEAYNVGLSTANLTKFELAETIKKYIPKLSITLDDFGSDPDKRDYIVSNKKLESLKWRPFYSIDRGIEELIKSFSIFSSSLNQFTNL